MIANEKRKANELPVSEIDSSFKSDISSPGSLLKQKVWEAEEIPCNQKGGYTIPTLLPPVRSLSWAL